MQTLAYLLPVLSKAIQNAEAEFHALHKDGKGHQAGTLQALVVVPSRELAMQIVRVAQGLLPTNARATIQQCIGGANPHRQVRQRSCWIGSIALTVVTLDSCCTVYAHLCRIMTGLAWLAACVNPLVYMPGMAHSFSSFCVSRKRFLKSLEHLDT